MARGRMINKRLCRSQKFAELPSDKARLLYVLLYTHADREGRVNANPDEVKLDCVPYLRWSVPTVAQALYDLGQSGLVKLYHVGHRHYIEFVDFEENQKGLRYDREAPSNIPSPDEVRSDSGFSPAISIKRKEKKENKTTGVVFSYEHREWRGITDEDIRGWEGAAPAVDVKLELNKMREWLLANPNKSKKNYRAFIVNWLSKEQQRGGTTNAAPAGKRGRAGVAERFAREG